MEDLVNTIKNDRLFGHMLSMIGRDNKPSDFAVNEKVIIMSPIDTWDTNIKRGMVGNINNIMHRYKGEPAEHHEFWVKMYKINGSARFEVYNILKYAEVEKFVEDWKKRDQAET